jgi:hypothetical protein
MKTKTIKRPEWWQPGMPLPHLSAMTVHTGQGALNRMKQHGSATTTLIPVRWETLTEWQERQANELR